MNKNVVALVLTAVLAAVILLPSGFLGNPAPHDALEATGSVQPALPEDGKQASADQDDSHKAPLPESGGEVTIEAEHVPDVVLVDLNDAFSIEQANERLASLDYIATDSVSESDMVYGYVELTLEDGIRVEDAMSRLEAEDFVAATQPNFVYHLLDNVEEPDDGQHEADRSGSLVAQRIDMIAQSTGVDPRRTEQWGLDAIGAIDAWKTTTCNHGVTVAVLDSGLDMDHQDFADGSGQTNVVAGYSVLQENKRKRGDRLADPKNYDDPIGHGTHVAGIISAGTNNAIGVAGVSYNANIMPVQVIDSNKDVTSAGAAAGIKYVLEQAKGHNVKVINISFGSTTAKSPTTDDDKQFMNALKDAHDAGILVVYAAGNGGSNGAYNCFPCDADPEGIGVISVMKSGSTYKRVSSSNYNKTDQRTKRLSAPGDTILSTWNNGSYQKDGGTSMAAPFVSGTAALVFAANPNLTAERVKDYLYASAKDINLSGWDNETGYGIVNAKDAVAWAKSGRLIKTIDSCTIDGVSNQSYTGREVKPAISVWDGGTRLKEGTDYSLTYRDNVNVGIATVFVSGKGKYFGDKDKTFVIKGKIASAAVPSSPCTYTGSKVQPDVIVKGNDGKTLTKGVDYTVAYSNNTAVGIAATATVTGRGNYTGSATVRFTITKKAAMHRLYNPNSGEHFYTASDSEYKNVKAAGWKDEGLGWTAPTVSNTPVYRLYNKYAGEHHYTTSKTEKNSLVKAGWRYEGIGWYSDDAKKVPLYREYNPNAFANNHNYTTSKKEHDWLISLGWRNEGYAWYGM